MQYMDSSKDVSYLHSTRGASQVAHGDNYDKEVKSPASHYEFLHTQQQSNADS